MKLKLDPYQKDILETKGNIALRSGRQCGKSTVISILAGREAATHKDKTILIISAVERQAQLLFDKVLNYLIEDYNHLLKKGRDRPTKHVIKLINGSIIYCLPCGISGYGLRGYTIDLLIADEAAYIPEAVWTAISPMISTRIKLGARMVLLSTPFGRQGYFARAFEDPSFTKFHISSEECDRIDKSFLAQEKARMSKREYAQEYLGEFIDELRQFFPDELIKKCMTAQRPQTIEQDPNYFLGVDIARLGKDESTFEIFKRIDKNNIIQIDNQITTKTLLSTTASHIIELDKKYNFNKIYLDDEGIGVGVFDILTTTDQTKRKTIGINNSQRVIDHQNQRKTKILKEDLYHNLLSLMERGYIKLLDDEEIFLSLKSVQYDYQNDTLGRTHLKIFGTYTHIVEGIIRACWCMQTKHLNIWISSF